MGRIGAGKTLVALVVKNPPAKAGDIKDLDSIIPGSGRSPGGGRERQAEDRVRVRGNEFFPS